MYNMVDCVLYFLYNKRNIIISWLPLVVHGSRRVVPEIVLMELSVNKESSF